MFQHVCTIEPSFFNTTLLMHRHPFDGRHLVHYLLLKEESLKNYQALIVIYCDG